MKLRPAAATLAALLALGWTAAEAQSSREQRRVYQCGPGQLSDRPCGPDAAASTLSFDQPSAADRRAAEARYQAEARRAEAQRRERLRAEALAYQKRSRPAVIQGSPAKPGAAAAPASAAARSAGPGKPTKTPKAPKAPKEPKAPKAAASAP
jgi:hypothetical protein